MSGSALAELDVQSVSYSFGGLKALDNVDVTVRGGSITSLIGPNGAGKTTLFNVITGFLRPEQGQVMYRGRAVAGMRAHDMARMGVTRTFQDLRLFLRMTTLENVLLAVPRVTDDLPRAVATRRMLRSSAVSAAVAAMDLLDITQYADELAGNLSYGLQKRLAIARAVATNAQLILLDEPTAGLQPTLVQGLLAIVRKLVADGKTVVLIDHNMEAVMGVSDWIVVLDHGRKIAEGIPAEIRNNEQVLSVYLGVA
jgi:branched-chain amino acid transport system ATP-binding protein